VTAGRTLMRGNGQIPEMASNRTRSPTAARLVAPGGVCQRARLIRSTALRTERIRANHFVKR
jgi:hypothetical protein